MARIKLGFPLVAVTGNFGKGRYRTTKAGTLLYAPKGRPKTKIKGPKEELKCPCAAWKLADATWVGMTEAEQQVWIDALKKPGMSGYDLFMKEAVTCMIAGNNSPITPSISGGWSTTKVKCDGPIPPPEACIDEPPPPEVYHACCNLRVCWEEDFGPTWHWLCGDMMHDPELCDPEGLWWGTCDFARLGYYEWDPEVDEYGPCGPPTLEETADGMWIPGFAWVYVIYDDDCHEEEE